MAGAAHAQAVGQAVEPDRAGGQQREAERRPLAARPQAAAPGQADDAQRDDGHAQRLGRRQRLVGQKPGAEGDQQRGGATGDRVDLAQVAGAIGQQQGREVGLVQQHREQQPGPGRRRRQRHEGQPGEADQAADADHQRHGRHAVRPALDQRVPGGMEQRGQQDQSHHAGTERHRASRRPRRGPPSSGPARRTVVKLSHRAIPSRGASRLCPTAPGCPGRAPGPPEA